MHKLLLLILVLFVTAGIVAPQEEESTVLYSTISPAMAITSSTNDQDYLIYVSLPIGYDPVNGSYPVLYLLDPALSFGTVSDFTRLAALDNELPRMIVVGIGYPVEQAMTTVDELPATGEYMQLRERDYAGTGNDEFLEFLTTELIPLIDSTYRTDPADRTIMGASLGGSFVLYAFANATGTFGRYISYAPATACNACNTLSSETPVRLSLLVGDNDSLLGTTRSVFTGLEAANYDWLDVSIFVLENTTHFTGRAEATKIGLKAVFCEDPVGGCVVLPVTNQAEE